MKRKVAWGLAYVVYASALAVVMAVFMYSVAVKAITP